MMLLKGDVLVYPDADQKPLRTIRLLEFTRNGGAYVIDVYDRLAVPELVSSKALSEEVKQGTARLLKPDPFGDRLNQTDVSAKHAKRRDIAWALIEELVNTPGIFLPVERAALVDARVEQGSATRVTFYKHLRRYWQRGMVVNALLPDYAASGGRGKERKSTEGVKRGRPRIYGGQKGVNVDSELRRIFQVSVDRFYATSEKFSKRGAYDEMIKEFFCDRTVDPETNLIIHGPKGNYAETGFPTYDQFAYWLDRDTHPLIVKRQRMGARRYDKDLRGLVGTSTAETWGPGARYQIDATIADVFLVSRFNRKRIIGRPVVYVVIDVFSRMITGLYVGLEGPSWVGAMMALANTASDKVAYCARFGRIITPEEWPCHFLPAAVLGDRGEIESAKIDLLLNNFNVRVETAAAYRADWKGVVERRFRLLPAVFKPYVPGSIDVDYRARGGKDYRLDAVLDLDQFTQILIHCALYFNNCHELTKYDKDRDVAANGVPAIPCELWEWGIHHITGKMRSFPEDQVRFSLLPVDEATVTVHGLLFKGSYYTCPTALEERWFDQARQRKSWRVRVSYDPRTIDEICLHSAVDPRNYQTCTLTERSRAHRDLSLWEIEQQLQLDKHITANRRQGQQLAKADLAANIEQVVEDAVAMKPDAYAESAASRTQDIRANRAAEKQANRDQEAFRLGGSATSSRPSAQIMPFPGSASHSTDYSEPDITELSGEDGDE